MFFIPYDEWMELTYSRISSRSPALLALDEAIGEAEECSEDDATVMRWFRDGGDDSMPPGARMALEIEQAERGLAIAEVRKAFNVWTTEQARRGKDWHASVRNEKGACQKLADQIAYWTRTFPDKGERAALDCLVEERNKSIPSLFKDCEVIVYHDTMTDINDKMAKGQAAKIAVDSYKLAGSPRPGVTLPPHHGGGGGLTGRVLSQVDGLLTEAFGCNPAALVWDAAEGPFRAIVEHAIHEIKDEIAALAPGVGLVAAGATLAFNAVKLGIESYDADQMVDMSQKLEIGDSRAAMDRVRDWQLRAIAARTAKVARAGVNVSMHSLNIASAGLTIPAQLATSLISAIVALGAVLGELGMQYKESRKLAAYLKKPDLGRDIFGQAPLAAAYYLLNTPDSHIALQLVTIGAPGWQAQVEQLKKDGVLKTTLSESARLIGAARYRIKKRDGSRFREVVAPSLATKIKKKVASIGA